MLFWFSPNKKKIEEMERLRSELSQEQQKSLVMAGAAVLATGTLYYLKKKLLGARKS